MIKPKLPVIVTVSVLVIALISFGAIVLLNRQNLPGLQPSTEKSNFISPDIELSPFRIEENKTAVFKFTALPQSKVIQIKVTTDLKKTAEWQNISTYIRVPITDLGDSGKVYVQGRTASGELTEIISDTINPSAPPVQTQ